MSGVSVASIVGSVFDSVGTSFTDVINDVTVTHATAGAYDPETGSVSKTEASASGRLFFGTEKALADIFPAFVVGPRDRLAYIEGISFVPAENDTVTVGAQTYKIIKVGDIVEAGALFVVVLR